MPKLLSVSFAALAFAAASSPAFAMGPIKTTAELLVECETELSRCEDRINARKVDHDVNCRMGVSRWCYKKVGEGDFYLDQVNQIVDWLRAHPELSDRDYSAGLDAAFDALWRGP